jgi:hypothetical protein
MRFLKMLQSRQSVDPFSCFLQRYPYFVEALQVKPKFGRRTEQMGESKGRITRNGSLAVQDPHDTIGRDIEPPCELGSAHAQFFEFFSQMFARVNCMDSHNVSRNGSQRCRPSMDRLPNRATQSRVSIGR